MEIAKRRTVYDALQERLRFIFKNYDYIYVSFSGGKDSGVLLNACIDYIRKHNLRHKLGVFHLDYEVQYGKTTEYVDQVLASNRDLLEVYRACVPVKVLSSTSMYQQYWRPWDPDMQKFWVRSLPKECHTVSDFDFYNRRMWDYEFQYDFASWLRNRKKAGSVACLVGIRTQESFNRWRTIHRPQGVARKNENQEWRFLGVLPLYDPPREDSKATLETAKQMGINVKMVTGDQLAIAKEISQQLGLGTNIVDAKAFVDADPKNDEALAEMIEGADGFAQVFPEHKYHIVESLQHCDHFVGMTGDGVNDAPALKEANAGIAVSGATDAARAAADIVLLTPGLSVIIDAIQEARRIFQRMNSYAIYRIAETIRVLLFMTLSILVFNFYPVTAIMIVLLALLNDGAILSIAYDRVQYSSQPEKWNMRSVLTVATVLGLVGVVASFGLFYLGERVFHLNRDVIQTLIYLKLSVAGHLTIFVTRTRKPFWASRPAPILLGAVLVTQVIATLISVYGVFMTPIGWGMALLVWGYALTWLFFNDFVKMVTYRILERGKKEVALA